MPLDNADLRSAPSLSVSVEHNRAADIPAAHDHLLAVISSIAHGRDSCVADFPTLQLQPLELPSGPPDLSSSLAPEARGSTARSLGKERRR